MNIKAALAHIGEKKDLTTTDMRAVMQQIMTGASSDAELAAFLMGLKVKGESIDEIVGAVEIMRALSTAVPLVQTQQVVDIVGTGGDGANIFNVSTAAALVVAAAGGKVAKHGNRAVSSKSGSADLLEAAGVYLALTPLQVARCVEAVGIGFMFAQVHHQAMRHAAQVRRALGVRTLFNLLGPLTNPAGVQHQVIGVFSPALCRPFAEVLHRLGSRHVLVVHAQDGLDEFSLAASTQVVELKNNEITQYSVTPEQFGLVTQSLSGLTVENSSASLALIRDALGRHKTELGRKAGDMIVLSAGAALYAADISSSLAEGVARAHDTLHTGLALEKLQELADCTAIFRGENAQ